MVSLLFQKVQTIASWFSYCQTGMPGHSLRKPFIGFGGFILGLQAHQLPSAGLGLGAWDCVHAWRVATLVQYLYLWAQTWWGCMLAAKELCFISVGPGCIHLHQKLKLMDARSLHHCYSTITKLSSLDFNLVCQRDWYISLLLWPALLWVWSSSAVGGTHGWGQ